MISLFYHYIPSKKNSKNIRRKKNTGKLFIVSSDQYQLWHEWMTKYNILKDSTYLFTGESKDDYYKSKNLYVSALFFRKDRNGSFDLTNTMQSIEDLLTDTGYIQDDNKNILQNFQYSFEDIKHEDNLYVIFALDKERFLTKNELKELYKEIKSIQKGNPRPKQYDLLLEKKKELYQQNKKNKSNKKKKTIPTNLDI